MFAFFPSHTQAMPEATPIYSRGVVVLNPSMNAWKTCTLFRFGDDFANFRDHALHHPLDASLEGDHAAGTARAGALQHEVDDAFVVAPELDCAAVHFHRGTDVIFQQFLDALDHVIVVRVDRVGTFRLLYGKDFFLVDDGLPFLQVFLQELPDGGDHVIPIGVRRLRQGDEIAGDENGFY